MHVQSILWYVRLIIFVPYEFLAHKPLSDLLKVKKSNLSAQDFDILDDGFPPEPGSIFIIRLLRGHACLGQRVHML